MRRKNHTHSRENKGRQNRQILFGIHPCVAALENPEREILKAQVTSKTLVSLDHSIQKKLQALRANIVDGKMLDQQLSMGEVHQGILLEVKPLEEPLLEVLASQCDDGGVFLLLDQVTDPHNVGAILRSAAVFGVKALLMPQHNSAEINGTLAKCASGALEQVPIITVTNLKQSMDFLKGEGFWCVGLDETGSQEIGAYAFDAKTVFVLGAEGKGLRRLTKETCDVLVRLPSRGAFQTLNVSNAAAVGLYELFCQSTDGRKNT